MFKDETGRRYGKLVVNKVVGRDKCGLALWLCHCDCGSEVIVRGAKLRSGHTRSCGCLKNEMKPLKDETGNRYGKLTVEKFAGKNKDRHILWLCHCDCGSDTIVGGSNLRSGHTRSCGCLTTEATIRLNRERVGAKSSAWKGGRWKHGTGYVYVQAKYHPRTNKSGYIPEHVLVAERALGEYLPKGSIIHHINGIRHDNRLENLWWFPSQAEHTAFHHEQRRFQCS